MKITSDDHAIHAATGSLVGSSYEYLVSSICILDSMMEEMMLSDCLIVATEAFKRFDDQHEAATYIKQQMDKMYQPTWHCIVGGSFGCAVTNVWQCSAYFYVDKNGVFVFKSKHG